LGYLVTSIIFSTIDTLEDNSILGDLFSEEMRRKSGIETSTLEAMVARGRSIERGEKSRGVFRAKSEGKKSKLKCWHCNKLGHIN